MAFGTVNVVPPLDEEDIIQKEQLKQLMGVPKGLATLGEDGKLNPDQMPEIKIEIPPDFDNLLAWPGCKRITPPKDETANTYTETIVNSTTNALRAKRVTVQNGESDYTETCFFYEEDGVTLRAKYVVHTTKDTTETWTEDVTKEETE